MAYAWELEAEHSDHVVVTPEDEQGMLDLDAILTPVRPGCLVYACGPESMLTAVEARMSGWPTGALALERFVAQTATKHDLRGDSFDVVLNDGRRVTVPSGTSVLEALRNAGLDMKSSCEGGTCGTCEVAVTAGVPDHRDDVLTDEERAESDAMMICVSRSHTAELRLDV
jgi:ferredoxin